MVWFGLAWVIMPGKLVDLFDSWRGLGANASLQIANCNSVDNGSFLPQNFLFQQFIGKVFIDLN